MGSTSILYSGTHFRDNQSGTLSRNSVTTFLDTERVVRKYLRIDTHFRKNKRRGTSARNSATPYHYNERVMQKMPGRRHAFPQQ